MAIFEGQYEEWRGPRTGIFQVEARNLLDAYIKGSAQVKADQYGCHLSGLRDGSGVFYASENLELYLHGKKRFILLSGPSGVGKGPIQEAVAKMVPFKRPVLYTSRAPRKDEKDGVAYHFRSRQEIESFRGNPGFIVGEVRDMVQAIDLTDLDFSSTKVLFLEAYHTLGSALKANTTLPDDVIPISVFVSPFSAAELASLRAISKENMERKVSKHALECLVRRSAVKEGIPYESLTAQQQIDLQVRAQDAIHELRSAHKYDFVLINHDAEGHPDWGGNLAGDALRSVEALSRIARFGIYRPEIIIQESAGDRLFLHPTAPSQYAAEAIEFWDERTV